LVDKRFVAAIVKVPVPELTTADCP